MNISISNAIQSSAISGGGEPSALPLALNLSITGGFAIGSVQTGNYTYFDPNGVAESGTTFKWYRVDGSTRTEVGTAQNYTLVAADEQKAIEFEVTPRNADPLVGPTASVQKNIPLFPVPPTATNVSFTGTLEIGQQMQGSYDYGDINGEPESGTTFKWWRADNAVGTVNRTEISGATSINYTLVSPADEGKYIQFQVTPRNDIGEVGSMSPSSWRGAVDSLPVASNVTYTGNNNVGELLSSSFDYSDANNDPEGTSLYQWLTSATSSGAGTPISGATSANYTVAATDEGNFLSVRVTPVTSSGVQGLSVSSSARAAEVGPLPGFSTNPSFTGILKKGDVLTGTYVYNSASATQGTSTFKWYNSVSGAISGATSLTYTLQASDISDNISFGVTPVSNTGVQGTEFITPTQGPILDTDLVLDNLEMLLNFTDTTISNNKQYVDDASTNSNKAELLTGKALDFNGSTEYVNTTGFEMAGTSATFAFWIYPKDTSYQFVMDLDGTVRTILGLFNGGSGQVFAFFNFGFKQFGTPIQNQWQRVVFRVNATTVECYVDGVKSGSTLALTSSINLSTVGNSVIGGRFDTTDADNRFDGSLSDFQIYNAYWSTDDIAFDYANPQNLVTDRSGTSIVLSNLKAYWAMSEGAGSVAYDSSGEGNNGTINGATYELTQPRIQQLGMMNFSNGAVATGVTLIPDPNNTSQDIDGNAVRDRLNSFNLDGVGHATIADSTSLNISNGTLQFWLKTTDTAFTILSGQSSSEFIGKANVTWFNNNAGTITVYKDNVTSSSNNTPDTDGNWHFYTFTGINVSSWTAFEISNLASFELDGLLDSVLIYSDVLTSAEIIKNYNFTEPDHQ